MGVALVALTCIYDTSAVNLRAESVPKAAAGVLKGEVLPHLTAWPLVKLQGSIVAAAVNSSAAATKIKSATVKVDANTVMDFGFYDGADSWQYLSGGYKVIAIEADPSLVQKAQTEGKFAAWLASGQLTLVNAAIMPSEGNSAAWTTFYLNQCTKEWNSFYKGVGCRSCTPPHPETAGPPDGCTAMQVQAMTCDGVLAQYGVPTFLKLDIEGAESGCWKALGQLPLAGRPAYVSNEVGNVNLIDELSMLGYQSFKVVLQKQTGVSGPWGDAAQDCKFGAAWRQFGEARWELNEIFNKASSPGDPCPGMKQGVGGGGSYVWYDLHASMTPAPPAAGVQPGVVVTR